MRTTMRELKGGSEASFLGVGRLRGPGRGLSLSLSRPASFFFPLFPGTLPVVFSLLASRLRLLRVLCGGRQRIV